MLWLVASWAGSLACFYLPIQGFSPLDNLGFQGYDGAPTTPEPFYSYPLIAPLIRGLPRPLMIQGPGLQRQARTAPVPPPAHAPRYAWRKPIVGTARRSGQGRAAAGSSRSRKA
ncbi:hypothetical protein GCM10022420_010620 [Streptomyces iranensis]